MAKLITHRCHPTTQLACLCRPLQGFLPLGGNQHRRLARALCLPPQLAAAGLLFATGAVAGSGCRGARRRGPALSTAAAANGAASGYRGSCWRWPALSTAAAAGVREGLGAAASLGLSARVGVQKGPAVLALKPAAQKRPKVSMEGAFSRSGPNARSVMPALSCMLDLPIHVSLRTWWLLVCRRRTLSCGRGGASSHTASHY